MSETALSAIAEINPGARIPKEITGSDEVSFIPMSDVSESGDWVTQQTRPLRMVTAGFTAFEEGDVLVAKITPCLENGKGAHARGLRNGIGFGSTEFHVLRAKQGVEPRFVFHITQSRRFRQAAERQMVGSAGQQRVQRQFFDEFLVRDFSPCEQRVIAQILDTLDTAIRETEALIDKLKAVKQGLLHDLLTRGIDANGQLRPPQSEAPQRYKASPLGWIPREWEATLLGACTSWASGGTPSRAVASHWIGNVPLLTPKDMKSFELSDTVEHVSAAAAESGSRLMPAETVFIVVRGMILAHSFPVVLAARPMAFNQDVKAISAGVQLHPRFLAYWLVANSDGFLRKVTEATHGTKKLDMENLVGFPIGLPSLQEQAAIIARLDAASEKHARETAYLAQLSVMKTGLMDDLLTGRVRVTPLLESMQQAAAQIVQQPVGQTGT